MSSHDATYEIADCDRVEQQGVRLALDVHRQCSPEQRPPASLDRGALCGGDCGVSGTRAGAGGDSGAPGGDAWPPSELPRALAAGAALGAAAGRGGGAGGSEAGQRSAGRLWVCRPASS